MSLVCKSHGTAIAALETITAAMSKGTQRDTLVAIYKWLNEIRPAESREELIKKLNKIFEGDAHDRLGREWYVRGSKKINGNFVPSEPGHGARVHCLWNAKTKKWEPEHLPTYMQKQTEKINEGE